MIPAKLWQASLLCALFASPALGQEQAPIAIAKSGGGFLVTDGISSVPLALIVNGGPKIKDARVVAEYGKISNAKVTADNRVEFLYTTPKQKSAVEEILDVNLDLSDNTTRSEAFTLLIPAPGKPSIDLEVEPGLLPASTLRPVKLNANAFGKELYGIAIEVDSGKLQVEEPDGDESNRLLKGSLLPPRLPPDAPSYLLTLATTAGSEGYSASLAGVSVQAPVRISVEIPPGSKLVVEGAENKPKPVPAPADGRTVIENVLVRFESKVRVLQEQDGQQKELPVMLPSGSIPSGVVAKLPGQAIADGGTGPTLVVGIPPTPFGGPVFWPELRVEGAKIKSTVDINERVKALVLERPTEANTVRVYLDDQLAKEISFSASRGQTIEIADADADTDERGAVTVVVKNGEGELTDFPAPRVRIAKGERLRPRRQSAGTYRVSIPPSNKGKTGDQIEVVAQLEPAPAVVGDVLEFAQASTKITLRGPGPAIKAKTKKPPKPKAKTNTKTVPFRFGLSGGALVGGSLGSLLVVGGGINFEMRLPFVDQRFALRLGGEFVHASGGGEVELEQGRSIESKTTVAGFVIPIQVGFAVVKTALFELLILGGGEVRSERAVVTVGGDSPGGGSQLTFGGRAGADAIFNLGAASSLSLGATASALGVSANGFSTADTTLSGSLLNIRAEVSYRFWF